MSFILDALKKSEAERIQQDTPGFSDVPGSTKEKSASHWIWIIVVLIGINLTVLIVMFMKPDSAQESNTVIPTARAPAESSSAPEILAEANRSQPATRVITLEPGATASTNVVEQDTPPPITVDYHSIPRISESVATFNNLRAQGMLTLPDMHLDIHVYSREPEDRFVFVNMSKYKENAVLDEGPVVREITPDGVILDYLGTGFLLPRE